MHMFRRWVPPTTVRARRILEFAGLYQPPLIHLDFIEGMTSKSGMTDRFPMAFNIPSLAMQSMDMLLSLLFSAFS